MIIRRMEEELRSDYQIELVEASTPQIHKALSNAVMYAISDNWRKARREHEHVRRAYYFSAEYLMGRMVFNNLYCLGILDQIRDLLRARGCDIASMEDIEDAALGNGGLGRLAASSWTARQPMTFLWTATASAINSVSSNRASRTAISARRRTTGSATATPGAAGVTIRPWR